MTDYKKVKIDNLKEDQIDLLYSQLLEEKYSFMILCSKKRKFILTKERTIIEIDDLDEFLDQVKKDRYYKTIIMDSNRDVDEQDLNIYQFYVNLFKDKLLKRKYHDQYYFGCVAVKTNKGIITTIRGKKNLAEYTIIKNVDHDQCIIYVNHKKATLNAPLLDYLFKNEKVKTIVHLHEFDPNLPYDDYAFPGTVRDSIRDNTKSFNITGHGVIYLFDEKGNIL